MDDRKSSWATVIGTLAVALTVPAVLINLVKSLSYKTNMTNLKNKVVVITGASSGIGEALAHQFYQFGCRVVLCARRESELERVRLDLLRKYPTIPTHPPIVVALDLSKIAQLENAVRKIIDVTGRIDLLINNGGISNRGPVVETENEVFMQIMTVNYFGTVALTKAVLPFMIQQSQGHIVFMSSVQGLIAIPNRAAYSSSKHALKAFSDSLRAEIAKYNIYVTVINPGYVNTSLSLNALTGTGQVHGKMDPTTAAGVSPEYVAKETALAISQKRSEIVLAPILHKLVILLRTNLPSLYFYIMRHRAKSE